LRCVLFVSYIIWLTGKLADLNKDPLWTSSICSNK
jgi:hypothetical protein